MTEAETRIGANNRVKGSREQRTEADYVVGIEGGIDEDDGQLYTFAIIRIQSKNGKVGESYTCRIFLPKKVSELVKSGMELGHANDKVFWHDNSKHHLGASGILTHGLIPRTELYQQAITIALIPFKNPDLY